MPPRDATKPSKNDIPTEEPYKGHPKLKYTTRKNNFWQVAQPVNTFIKEFLQFYKFNYFENVTFLKEWKFWLYLPDEGIVLDYKEPETPSELEEAKLKREFCRRYHLRRIIISEFNYKNILIQIL